MAKLGLYPKIKQREIRDLFKFLENYNLKEGVVITKSLESRMNMEGKRIMFLPLWKWLLQ